jgi:hypothetical protein
MAIAVDFNESCEIPFGVSRRWTTRVPPAAVGSSANDQIV